MALDRYGVLNARAVERRREGATDTPHFEIHAVDADGEHHRIAVNVQSQQPPSELLYVLEGDLRHPVTSALSALMPGWNALAPQPGGASLDFIRANLFDPAQMRLLPPDVSGPDNDLADLLDHYVVRAIADPAAALYAFGQRWGPEPQPDKVFGFSPGGGVHDIHMNQGNTGQFRRDDGVWQDGALLIHFPAEPRWVGIFLAFQSQAWHTDDVTGHAITAPAPAPAEASAVQIVAALVNPVGPAPERESVVVLNASPDAVDLTGWRIADRLKRSCPVSPGPLAAGATLEVVVSGEVQLGNQGGTITLLDAAGVKVSGVSYTSAQAKPEGLTIVF